MPHCKARPLSPETQGATQDFAETRSGALREYEWKRGESEVFYLSALSLWDSPAHPILVAGLFREILSGESRFHFVEVRRAAGAPPLWVMNTDKRGGGAPQGASRRLGLLICYK